MNANPASSPAPEAGRRSFIGKLAWLAVGFVASATALIAGVTAFGPSLRRRSADEAWSPVATFPEIPESKPTRFNVVVTERAGWLANNTQEAVWVVRRGDQVVAFSAVCPHAGCPIGLEARGFFCSCHGSRWTVNGEKSGGPAPRNMDSLEARARGNIFEVKYQRFKTGIAQKEPNV